MDNTNQRRIKVCGFGTLYHINLRRRKSPFGLSENTLDKTDLQKFFKRLRKNGEIVSYYAVGEYGTTTLRAHYHIILFNCQNEDNIVKSWKLGFCKVDKVEGASIHYVTKYHVNKTHYPNGSEKPFALISKRPAIGSNYINRMKDYHEGNIDRAFYTELGGRKQKLPRYYRQRLYTETDNILISKKMSATALQPNPKGNWIMKVLQILKLILNTILPSKKS